MKTNYTNTELAQKAKELDLISWRQVMRVKHGQPTYVNGYGQKNIEELRDIVHTELAMKEVV